MALSLMDHGYVKEECVAILSKLPDLELESGGEGYALREMFYGVFRESDLASEEVDKLSLEEIIDEECVVLESIFGSDFERYEAC
jgi:hypothetical protein